jgi:signal transduction histidine kinase
VLQLVARRGRKLVEGDCALVRTLSADGKVLILRAAAWRHPNDALLVAPAREVLRGGSITGYVFDTGRPRLVTGRPRTARTQARSERPAWADPSPALYVPLNAVGRTLGTLVVMNWRSRRSFRRQDLTVLQLLANRAALGIHHASLNRDRERLAVTEERERLGRELHDGAIQSLYAVTLDLAGTIARTADHGLQEQLAAMAGRIDAVIQGLRAHIHQLRRDLNPSPLEDSS